MLKRSSLATLSLLACVEVKLSYCSQQISITLRVISGQPESKICMLQRKYLQMYFNNFQ